MLNKVTPLNLVSWAQTNLLLTDLCDASPLWYFLPQTDGLRALQLPAKRWRPQICDCACYTKWALFYSWFAWFLLTFSMGLKVLTILKVWPLQYLLESANILCRCNFSLVNLSRPYHVLFLSTGSVIKEKENLLYWPLVVETKANQTGERKSKTPITSFQSKPEQIWS